MNHDQLRRGRSSLFYLICAALLGTLIVSGLAAAQLYVGVLPAQPLAEAIDSAPRAHAGAARTVSIGETVRLDGSASIDANGDRLRYRWTLRTPRGSAAALSDASSVRPVFTVDLLGDYVATLQVDDVHRRSAPASVRVSTGNVAPVADAGGDRRIAVGETFVLDAAASSDFNGDTLRYHWRIVNAPAGSEARLSATRSSRPSLTADRRGDYIIELVADDGRLRSAAARVRLSTIESRPAADAGDARHVVAGTRVRLDATRSFDPDGKPLAYSWSVLHAPPGSNAAIGASGSARPVLRTDLPGLYIVQLIVNDGRYGSEPATVAIEASAGGTIMSSEPVRGSIDDVDGDGVSDAVDNCAEHFNPDQRDTNGDGLGNVCDPDLDNDGFVTNFGDLIILKAAFFSTPLAPTWNPDADFNGDDSVNFADLLIMKNFFFGPPGPRAITFSNPAGGSWHDPANWDLGVVPDQRYSVRIDLAPGMVVEYSGGDTTIAGLRTASDLLLSGGNLTVSGDAQLNGTFTMSGITTTLLNANIIAGTGAIIVPPSQQPTLDGVTLGAEIIVGNAAALQVRNGLAFDNGTVRLASTGALADLRVRGGVDETSTFSGVGEIVFDSSSASDTLVEIEVFDSLHNLAIGAGITVRDGTSGGRIRHRFLNGAIELQGTLVADLGGRKTTLQAAPFTISGMVAVSNGAEVEIIGPSSNSGTLTVTDSVLDIGSTVTDSWDNNGTIVADNATIELDGSFTAADIGTITGTGETILLGELDNTGQVLDLATDLGAPAVVLGNGGEIVGGSIATTPVSVPASTTFTFDGVDLDVDATVDNGGVLSIENGIVLGGVSITLTSNGSVADLRFRGAGGATSTLGGTGEVIFAGTSVSDATTEIEVFDSLHNLVIAPGVTVRTGTIGGRIRHRFLNGAITLQNTVIADVSGRKITIQAVLANLDGTLQISNGAEIELLGPWINTGTISVTDSVLDIGSTVTDSWDNNGTIVADNATIELDGSFTAADIGTLTGTGETILLGELDNTGQVLNLATDLGAPAVVLGNGGEIVGGSIATTPVSVPASTTFTFDGVDLDVDATVDNGGVLSIENGIVLGGVSITLTSNGSVADLRFRGAGGATSTLGGTGEVIFAGTSVSDATAEIEVFDSLHNLVIAPGVTVRTGTIGGRIRHRFLNGAITLQNTVIADVSGRKITIQAVLANLDGTLQISNGAEIELLGPWINTGTISVTDSVLDIGSTVTDSWDNNGTIVADNATIELDGSFTAADIGTLTGTGETILLGELDNTGQVLNLATDLGAPAVVLGNGGEIVGGSIATTPVSVPASTTFTFDGVDLDVDATVDNGGVLSIENGIVLGGVSITLTSNGSVADLRFRGAGGATSTLGGTGEVIFAGTSVSDATAEIEVFDSLHNLVIAPGVTVRTGTIGGRIRHRFINGAITLQGNLINDLPGRAVRLSAAPFTIAGAVTASAGSTIGFDNDFQVAASGTLEVEIGGTDPADFGVYDADNDAATLDGTLRITLVGAFSPGLGDMFEIMTFDSRTGTFATIDDPALGGALMFQVDYNATDVTLTVTN